MKGLVLSARAAAITGYIYCLYHTVSQHVISFILVRANIHLSYYTNTCSR